MRGLMLAMFLTLLPTQQVSSVRFLKTATGSCSAVVLSRHRAYTATHCLRAGGLELDGKAVIGFDRGHDLAELVGTFAGPYAVPGRLHSRVLLEGWGCDPVPTWFAWAPRRSVRAGEVGDYTPWAAGVELGIFGRVCHGDSGGAVWDDGGGLVGIMTARSDDAHGFATPTP